MFYVSCIHLFAHWVYERTAKRVRAGISAAIAIIAILLMAMVGKYVLCDTALPKYLGWFYVGYCLSFVFKFRVEGEGEKHSKASVFFSLLGKESLALYALHWWLFFSFLPIPRYTTIPQVAYAFVIFVIWLIASLILDIVISITPLAPYLLGKQGPFFQNKNR